MPTAPKPKPSRKEQNVRTALAEAVGSLQSGDGAKALDQLLAVWEKNRFPALSDAIVKLGAALEVPAQPYFTEQQKDYLAWCERARSARPVDVGPLLAAFEQALDNPKLREHFVDGRAKLLNVFPPDPRLGRFGLRIINERYGGQFAPNGLQRLVKRHLAPPVKEFWLRALNEKLRPPKELAVDDAIAAVRQAIEKATLRKVDAPTAVQPGVESTASMIAAIFQRPDDDQLRLIAADRLSEQGDPRGELIVLQFQRAQGKQNAEGAKREAQLIKRHLDEWLGPLAPHVRKSLTRFERGFPDFVSTTANRVFKAKESLALEAWATITRVEFGKMAYFGATMRGLKRADGVGPTGFEMLATLEVMPPLERLQGFLGTEMVVGSPKDWDWARAFARLPRLERLELVAPETATGRHFEPEPIVAAVAAGIPSSVKRLTLNRLGYNVLLDPGRTQSLLAMMPRTVERVELNAYLFNRAEGGWLRR